MKKLLSILLAAMLIVACFGMVGCGVKGKYELYAIEIAGAEVKEGEMFEMVKEEIGSFELAKDGVVKVNDKVIEKESWKKSDKGVDMYYDGELVQSFEKDGNKLILDMGSGMKAIFKKA